MSGFQLFSAEDRHTFQDLIAEYSLCDKDVHNYRQLMHFCFKRKLGSVSTNEVDVMFGKHHIRENFI